MLQYRKKKLRQNNFNKCKVDNLKNNSLLTIINFAKYKKTFRFCFLKNVNYYFDIVKEV